MIHPNANKPTKFVDIHGKVKYVDAAKLGKYGNWTITIYPTEKSLEVCRELQAEGVKNTLKKDDEGYYIAYRREPQKVIKGKMVAFAAPRCIDADAKPMDGNKIGWGSDVTVRLEVYYHGTPSGKQAAAARFDSVRVDNLVEWVPEQLPPAEREAHNSLVNAEEPEPW